MTTTTTSTPPLTTQPPPMPRHTARRLRGATLVFALGGIFGVGVGITVAADDSSDLGSTRDVVANAVPAPVAQAVVSPISADAMERTALLRQVTACTSAPTSADGAERCLTASG